MYRHHRRNTVNMYRHHRRNTVNMYRRNTLNISKSKISLNSIEHYLSSRIMSSGI
jgi:hypothetical protein